MLGALLIVLIRQSIRTLHFDQNYEWIIIGCATIIAVVLDRRQRQLHRAAARARGHQVATTAGETRDDETENHGGSRHCSSRREYSGGCRGGDQPATTDKSLAARTRRSRSR